VSHPIPDAALDDRLGIVGQTGSGKTYAAGTAVERLLQKKARVVVIDPLGVWYGLRLAADGKGEGFPVVIFGGEHGDLPLTEHAGALIGETVAQSSESCIISLAGLGTKAAERRFMLAFLTALYRHSNGEPVHLVFDEADMWAPQRLLDKEGEAAKLLGQMETIVRRGRVKGFIPWLITQRPAVLSKDVLSQMDGLVAMKLTSSQDRKAIEDWIEGSGDRAEGRKIVGAMPAMQRGTGVVWIPARDILKPVEFPAKITFDSSRTPKRGEKVRSASLKPIDLGKLRERLAKVETEIKANDPKALRARIAELERQAKSAGPDQAAMREAEQRGYQVGLEQGAKQQAAADNQRILEMQKAIEAATGYLLPFAKADDGGVPVIAVRRSAMPAVIDQKPRPAAPKTVKPADSSGVNGPQQRILDALAWWQSVGIDAPTRVQVAVVAGYSPEGGAFQNPLGALRTAGLIEYPQPGTARLTAAGARIANHPEAAPTNDALHAKIMAILDGPKRRILQPLLDSYPAAMDRASLAAAAGYEPSGGAFQNPLGALRSLGLIEYPASGQVVALPILFIGGRP
jgi:hypothetical protein